MSNPDRPAGGTWTEEDLICDAAAGPPGPRVGAFLDFDGTLIDGYSLSAFARYHLRSLQVAPADLGRMLLTGLRGVTSEADFEQFAELSMRVWAGRSEDELTELGERLWVQGVAGSLYPEALAAGGGASAGRAYRRDRLVGHPVPGGARGPGDGRAAHHRVAGGGRERDMHRPPRRPAAVAGRQGGGGARVRG